MCVGEVKACRQGMNNSDLSTITYRENFQELFEKYFTNNEVFLRASQGTIPVTFFGFAQDRAAFKIPHVKNMSREVTVYARSGNETAYAFLSFFEQQEAGVFIFIPQRVQVISQERKENRRAVDNSQQNKTLVFITGIMSDFILQNQISFNLKKIDNIREIIHEKLDSLALKVRLFLCNELKSDPRMRYFKSQRVPIYIPDFYHADEKDREKINYYLNHIHSQDHLLKNNKDYVSEISIPLLYNGKMPYGYLLVNSTMALPEDVYVAMKKSTIFIDKLFSDFEIFSDADDRMLVSNISESGFAVTINERRLIRYFKEESHVSLEMILPGQKKASILAEVRYINSQANKTIKIGFKILDIDALSEINFEEFLESLKKEKA